MEISSRERQAAVAIAFSSSAQAFLTSGLLLIAFYPSDPLSLSAFNPRSALNTWFVQTYLQVTQPVLTRLTRLVGGNVESGKISVASSVFSLLAREDGIVNVLLQS